MKLIVIAGIDQVVLGDLVYCKDGQPEIDEQVIIPCCEDTNSDYVDLDSFSEVPDVVLPVGEKSQVKVNVLFFIFFHGRILGYIVKCFQA